jgi:hypothetical protein
MFNIFSSKGNQIKMPLSFLSSRKQTTANASKDSRDKKSPHTLLVGM